MTLGTLVKATALVTFGALGIARGDEEKVSHEKLPAAVKAAIKARFPGAELKGAAKASEEGETIFEVLLTYKGDLYDVAVEPGGEIEEVERAILVEALPSAVVKAIKAKHPKAKIEKAEEVTDEEGEVFYEVAIEVGEKDIEVAVTPTGKIKKASEEEEGDEKAEKKAGKGEKKEKQDKDDDDDEKGEKHEKKAGKHEKAEKQADEDDGDKKAAKQGEKHEKKAGKHEEEDDDDKKGEKHEKKIEKKGEKHEKKADKDDDDDDDKKGEKKEMKEKKETKEKKEKKADKDDDDDDEKDDD